MHAPRAMFEDRENNMYILTGGAGFIGSALLSYLNSKGRSEILVVDNLASSEKWRNLRGKKFSDYVHKTEFLKRVENGVMPEKVDAIIHLGACSSTTEMNAEYMMANNYRYSRTLAEWALSKNIRFIYASSAATYGDGARGFSDEDRECEKLRPLNVYGFSKHLFDLWALETKATKKIAGIKFFNVYGPNEYHKGDMMSVICKAHEQILGTGKLKLFKSYRPDYQDGEQKRDFVYVKDCSEVIDWLLSNPTVSGIFNLGTGQARSWNDLAGAVFAAVEKKRNIEYIEMNEELRSRYQYFTEAQMGKLRAAGYTKPFTSLEDGVADYVKNYLAHGERYL